MNIYFIGSTIFCLAALGVIYWIHSQARLDIPTPHVAPPVGDFLPLVSVIVPTRNEDMSNNVNNG